MSFVIRHWSLVVYSLLFALCPSLYAPYSMLFAQTKIGAQVFFEQHLTLVAGKRVGVLCNSSSIVFSDAAGIIENKNLVDALLEKKVNVTAIFSPEHGFRSNVSAGEKIENQIDSASRIPIFSLYGKTLKPTSEMLHDIDILLFDLQDVGSRYFTYASTMGLAMEAASEYGKIFIILDRPNPIGGNAVEGFIREDSLQSFVGKFPLPNRHGLTLGELATMIVGEKWIPNSEQLNLKIIPCENWNREVFWNDTQLAWIPPSPNILSPTTALVYAGSCLFEGTNISEGRGTEFPFQMLGAPFVDNQLWMEEIEQREMEGVEISPISFIPRVDSLRAISPKYADKLCNGIFLHITDIKKFKPFETAYSLLVTLHVVAKDSLQFNGKQFDRLAGTTKFRYAIESGKSAEEFSLMWKEEAEKFLKKRKRYLLY